MRSSGVGWVVLGGVIALSVIWFGIRPGRRVRPGPTRLEATVGSTPESAEHGSRRLPPPAGAPERHQAPADGARRPEAAAPTAGVRAPRHADGRTAGNDAKATRDLDMDVNPPEDIPTLERVALTDPDPQRRAQAGVLLAATENPSVIPLLHQALSDKDPEVRHTLVKEIADLDFAPDTTIDLLSPVVMKDAEARNRVAALETLAAIGGDRVLTLATRLRKDPDQDIRVLAEKILHGAASGSE